MEKDIRGSATLTVPNRGKWRLKLLKDEDGIYFGDGWEIFFQENYLQITNLLVFTYHGNLKFNVDVYDDSGFKTN